MCKSCFGLIVSFILIMITMVGCNNSTEVDHVANNTEDQQSADNKDNAGNTDPVKTDEGIVELDLFVDQPWWPLKDWSGPVAEEITKQTGVRLNITVASDEQQLPLMIASNNLPDLVVTSLQFNRMSDPKVAYDWQSLMEQYTPEFEIAQERIGVNTVSDGKFYSVKNNFSTKVEWEANKQYALNGGAGIAYRADLMEEMGNPPVDTLDDFLELFRQVKKIYPDMTPLVLNPTDTWAKGYFGLNFGAQLEGFVEDENGKLVHVLRTEELENVYMFMNKLYLEGIIKPETYAYQNEDQAKSMATSGKAFAYAWTTAAADRLNAESEGEMEWKNLPLNINGDFSYARFDTGWQGVFITKNNKNPEASIKFMQYLMAEEGQHLAMWGIEGEHWNWSEDNGYPVFTYERNNDEVLNELGVHWWGLLAGSSVTEALGNFQPDTELTKTNRELNENVVYKPEIGMVVPAADSDEQVIETNIDNMIDNEESKVLLANSQEEAEAAYREMLKKAEEIGLADYEEWANEKYQQVLRAFE
ncbi:putative aldouronate transport system substrate-binding protein [Gracilibacillus ureilyticus]|uniref:Putative aldouronate transport system substrate-binding protein n=1 Tax=Gracilibacillus ureilyticus TaxID=531814 RepID=A0A1H9VWY9_9BACI|nr:extracellular solute-binding protein [Gracilibacillus ureilyticus]SES26185.1 putative aldouronate transport system substrate-binding protein [Gracilibacillus ureilyticus]